MCRDTFLITTGTRLHFGLLSLRGAAGRVYGGVGAMVARPCLELRITRSDQFQATGPLADRVVRFVHHRAKVLGQAHLPVCRIEVLQAPRDHTGLGVGTQLGLAVVAGLNGWEGGTVLGARQLAHLAGRARRSAVGTYGFLHGGLIYESGRSTQSQFPRLAERIKVPDAWRFVLLVCRHLTGLFGRGEEKVFQQLHQRSSAQSTALQVELEEHLLPAARAADFDQFSESLFRYGTLAGQSFARCQGGVYADPLLAEWVARIRQRGVAGVGQSSWGPTLFALLRDQAAAESFVDWFLRAVAHDVPLDWWITPVCNRGAQWQSV